MPVQNYFAGMEPLGAGIGNALVMGERLQQGRQANELAKLDMGLRQQRLGMDQQRMDAERQEGLDRKQLVQAYSAWKAGQNNPQYRAAMAADVRSKSPEYAALSDDEIFERAGIEFHTALGIAPQQPAKPEYRVVGRSLLELGEDGPRVAYREPLAPPGPAAQRAPSFQEILDPTNPRQLIRVDGNVYRGGGLGSPGVLGVSGKEPTAVKAEEKKVVGREAVSSIIAELRDLYNTLDELNAIPNPDEGAMSNLKAATGASAVGQMGGRLFGTKAQSARNQIAQIRPRLLSAVMAATGMSARQLDSNAELKLWLSAVSDPTLDVTANRAALDSIESQFGMAGAEQGGGGKFQVGKEYVDANGNRAVYLGNYDGQDRWEPR